VNSLSVAARARRAKDNGTGAPIAVVRSRAGRESSTCAAAPGAVRGQGVDPSAGRGQGTDHSRIVTDGSRRPDLAMRISVVGDALCEHLDAIARRSRDLVGALFDRNRVDEVFV